jgi:hypothetical protein
MNVPLVTPDSGCCYHGIGSYSLISYKTNSSGNFSYSSCLSVLLFEKWCFRMLIRCNRAVSTPLITLYRRVRNGILVFCFRMFYDLIQQKNPLQCWLQRVLYSLKVYLFFHDFHDRLFSVIRRNAQQIHAGGVDFRLEIHDLSSLLYF